MNFSLPITEFRDQIVKAVNDHSVVVITAETGAGKSTQVPQYLYEAGYTVVATQPRRMAARTVAQRVAEEAGTPLGEIVGFRTAEERHDSLQTQVLFCTDGLQLVRELTGRGSKQQILIIDEVHEWNRNIETLVAWAKYQLSLGHNFKVVLMSATVEAERLADYFGGAPVISVPGRLFPVEEQQREADMVVPMTAVLAGQGRNVLVFVPGKAEIERTIEELKGVGNMHQAAEILPLHGELTPDEQKRAFKHYGRPKVIVSTNVAQTSVTIDDIDAVVDSGVEKRVEVLDGVEGLYLGDISQADCLQRMGRAGRTKPGVYVLCSDTQLSERPAFPTAEILRSRLDQLVLRLAEIGLDATELEFFHQPSRDTLAKAKEALGRLGALDDVGKVTSIGRAMSRMPVDVHHARMIVEAEKNGVTDEILTIVACLEAGGIRGKGKKVHGVQQPPQWWQLTQERDSDLLAELDCFVAASQMNNSEMREADIHVKHFYRAKEIRARLARDLGASLHPSTKNDRQEVLKASVSGMVDHLYRHTAAREYVGMDSQARELDKNSVLRQADWVTAIPFDLELRNRWDEPYTLNLLTFASRVDPAWLKEHASPALAKWIASHEPEIIEINGVELAVRYSKGYLYTRATIKIPLDQLDKLEGATLELPSVNSLTLEIVDEQGAVVATGSKLSELKEQLQRHRIKQGYLSELEEKELDCNILASQGREVGHLHGLIAQARSKVPGMFGYFRSTSSEEVRQSIRRVEREIERLSGDASAVLLDDLMEGRIQHPDIEFNRKVVEQLDAYAVRSGGFIETLTDDQLRQHYQVRLAGTTRVDEVWELDLKLRLEDFAPADVLEELELAPETVELAAKKGTSTYTVAYGYEEIDGERVAVGAITVPIAVYERNCAEHGRRSMFPELPHGALLIVSVTDNNKPVARGVDGDRLKSQVKKYRKGKGNNRRDEETGRQYRLAALGIRNEGPTAPPPWHKGRAR